MITINALNLMVHSPDYIHNQAVVAFDEWSWLSCILNMHVETANLHIDFFWEQIGIQMAYTVGYTPFLLLFWAVNPPQILLSPLKHLKCEANLYFNGLLLVIQSLLGHVITNSINKAWWATQAIKKGDVMKISRVSLLLTVCVPVCLCYVNNLCVCVCACVGASACVPAHAHVCSCNSATSSPWRSCGKKKGCLHAAHADNVPALFSPKTNPASFFFQAE